MKKKLNIIEIIIAIVFIATTASAQKPNNIGKQEVLEITSTITYPVGVVAIDKKGSPYVRVEMTTKTSKMFMRNTQKWPRVDTCQYAAIVNGNLRWQIMSHKSILTANPQDKDNWGFIAFQSSVGSSNPDIPSINIYYAGILETEWSEAEQRFCVIGGRGTISGFSANSKTAKQYTDEAALGLQDRYLPAFGEFTIKPVKLTDAQIKAIIINK